MSLNKFDYNGAVFIVQSYLKDDFANIHEINGESYRIDFVNEIVTTSAKESKEWKCKSLQINFNDISKILNNIFSFKYCQSEIEDNGKCSIQCNHCKKYYKPLENEKQRA